jgi:hypothetical protein
MTSRSHGGLIPSNFESTDNRRSHLLTSRLTTATSRAAILGCGAPRFHPAVAIGTPRIGHFPSSLDKANDFDFLQIDRLWRTANGADDANLVARHQQSDDPAELFRRLVCGHLVAPDGEDDVPAGDGPGSGRHKTAEIDGREWLSGTTSGHMVIGPLIRLKN